MQHLQEDGSYNQLYPKSDSYSKNETLTNNTSQMFRIDNGTPEDVFKWLRKYNQHEWKRIDTTIESNLAKTNITKQILTKRLKFLYSKEISVENNIHTRLKNPIYTNFSNSQICAKTLAEQAPCYLQYVIEGNNTIEETTDKIFYVPSGATYESSSVSNSKATFTYASLSDDEEYLWFNNKATKKIQVVTRSIKEIPSVKYLFSENENTYPSSFTNKKTELSMVLNNPQEYSAEHIGKIDYGNSCYWDGSNIQLNWQGTNSLTMNAYEVNHLKNKYISLYPQKNVTNLLNGLQKMIFLVQDSGGDLMASSHSFVFTGQMVDFAREQNEYYTLQYKGIPFEKLKELTV